MDCCNYTGSSLSRISPSCSQTVSFFVNLCGFYSLSTSSNGGAISVTNNINMISVLSTVFYRCVAQYGGGIYTSGNMQGEFRKNCFGFTYSTGTGMTYFCTSSSGSKRMFEMNSITRCPPNYEGSLYVVDQYYGSCNITLCNMTYCLTSSHTMLDFIQTYHECRYNSICHNKMGAVYRVENANGIAEFSNHINHTVMGTDWGFSHDYGSSIILHSNNIYVDNLHSYFSYGKGASMTQCFVFGCSFAPNNVPTSPKEMKYVFLNTAFCEAPPLFSPQFGLRPPKQGFLLYILTIK